MSHPKNEQWIEAAIEMFEEAMQDKNLPLMEDIIQDMKDAGFTNTAAGCEQRAKEKFSNDWTDKADTYDRAN